jgi:type IV secretory pathway TrbF-like protein
MSEKFMSPKSFFSNKNSKDEQKKITQATNPYVKGSEGQRIWNDRYLSMSKATRHWQMAFFGLLVLTIIMFFVAMKFATEQTKFEAVAVETCQGAINGILPTSSTMSDNHKEVITDYALKQFIINARTIILDKFAKEKMLDKVYAYSADQTLPFFKDYYGEFNPYEIAKNYTTHINILNTYKLSKNTWQITWDEIRKDAVSGQSIDTKRWIATLSHRFGNISPSHKEDNPFGLYVTSLSWSEVNSK